MTPKQEAFVREYVIDLNATQAAIRAGYSERTARSVASENLTKPDIADAIANLKAEHAAQTGIDARWVLTEAQAVYRAARNANRLPDAIRALELVGKHVDIGAFKERIEHSGPNGGPIALTHLTDDQLAALAAIGGDA